MLLELIINNSYSQIKGFDAKLLKELKKALCYRPDSKVSYYTGGFVRPTYLIDSKGNFPTGLLSTGKSCLKGHMVKITDLRKVPTDLTALNADFGSLVPYSEQLEAVSAAISCHRGIISAATGSGKSLMIALLIRALQCRTLIVTPSLELKKQLSDSMAKWFGAGNVGRNKHIYVENVQALDPKTPQMGYDCVCIDEFHHSGAKTYRVLNKHAWKNIYYRFGFTATPFRNADNEKILLESVLSSVIYELSIKKAIKNKYIVPVEAYYIELPKQNTEAYTWAQVYSELIVNNDSRNKLLGSLLQRLNEQGLPALCLVKEIAHGAILEGLTGISFVSGENEATKTLINQFNAGKINALIGTTGIIGEGIDTKPAEYIIIAGLGKAKSAFLQQIGRGVRKHANKESCKIILFKDTSHKFCLRHFKAQCKILKDELNIIPTALKFTD